MKMLTRKNLDPRNTHDKKFQTHEISTRKNLGPTKYPREKTLDPRNTHEKKVRTHEGTVARWQEAQETLDDKRLTEFSNFERLQKKTFFQ